MLSLLQGDVAEGHWFGADEIAQNVVQSLPRWDDLARILGPGRWASRVREVVDGASTQSVTSETQRVLDLAERYLDGWRPRNEED